jgi:hypothetical protein
MTDLNHRSSMSEAIVHTCNILQWITAALPWFYGKEQVSSLMILRSWNGCEECRVMNELDNELHFNNWSRELWKVGTSARDQQVLFASKHSSLFPPKPILRRNHQFHSGKLVQHPSTSIPQRVCRYVIAEMMISLPNTTQKGNKRAVRSISLPGIDLKLPPQQTLDVIQTIAKAHIRLFLFRSSAS